MMNRTELGQEHGRAAWTQTFTMDMEMDKHHGCQNAGMPKKV
jgi:hypothetical protein